MRGAPKDGSLKGILLFPNIYLARKIMNDDASTQEQAQFRILSGTSSLQNLLDQTDT